MRFFGVFFVLLALVSYSQDSESEPVVFEAISKPGTLGWYDVSPDGSRFAVSDLFEDTVRIYSTEEASPTLVHELPVPLPVSFLFRGDQFFVLSAKPPRILVYDTRTWEQEDELIVPAKQPLRLFAPGEAVFGKEGTLYVTENAKTAGVILYGIDTRKDKGTQILNWAMPVATSVAADGDKVFTTMSGTGHLSRYDGSVLKLVSGGVPQRNDWESNRKIQTQPLVQIGETAYWVIGSHVLSNMKLLHEAKRTLFADRTGTMLYHLETKTPAARKNSTDPLDFVGDFELSMHALNTSFEELGRRPVTMPQGVLPSDLMRSSVYRPPDLAHSSKEAVHLFYVHSHGRNGTSSHRAVPGSFLRHPENTVGALYYGKIPLVPSTLCYAKMSPHSAKQVAGKATTEGGTTPTAPNPPANTLNGGFHSLPLPSLCNHLVPSDNGSFAFLAHAESDQVSVWSAERKAIVKTLKVPNPDVIRVCGKKLVAADRRGKLRVVDIFSGEIERTMDLPQNNFHLSPIGAGDTFDGDVITTGFVRPGEFQTMTVNILNGRHTEARHGRNIWSGSLDGTYIIGHPGQWGKLLCKLNAGRWDTNIARTESYHGPVYQHSPGPFYFTRDQTLHGMPPIAVRTAPLLVVPDLSKKVVYELSTTNITVRSRTRDGRLLSSFPLASPPPAALKEVPNFREKTIYSPPFACVKNGQSHLFVHDPASGRVLYGAWGKNELNQATSLNQDLMCHVGKAVDYHVEGAAQLGEYKLMDGPENATVDEQGAVVWTPSAEQEGSQNFKVRVKREGKTAFKRFTLRVVPAKVETSLFGWMTSDPTAIEKQGEIPLESTHTRLSPLQNGQGTLLLTSSKLRWLDPTGKVVRTEPIPTDFHDVYDNGTHFVGHGGDRVLVCDRNTLKVLSMHSFKMPVSTIAPIPGTSKVLVSFIWSAKVLEALDEGDPYKAPVLLDLTENLEPQQVSRPLEDWSADEIHVSPDGKIATIQTAVEIGKYVSRDFFGFPISHTVRQTFFLTARIDPNGDLHHLGTASLDGSMTEFSPEGKHVTVYNDSSTLNARQVVDPEQIDVTFEQPLHRLAYHPRQHIAAGISLTKMVVMFDRATGKRLKAKLLEQPGLKRIDSFAWSADGSHLLITGSNSENFYTYFRVPVDVEAAAREAGAIPGYVVPSVGQVLAGPSDFGQAGLPRPASFTATQLGALRNANATQRSPVDISNLHKRSTVQISTEDGSGSGFFISDVGHILTCQHVLNPGEVPVVRYTTSQGKTVEEKAYVLKANADLDIALLAVRPPQAVIPVRLETDRKVEMGQAVYVIGNPGLGDKVLEQTMTQGIVSSPKRKLSGAEYIQTSAAVNPGSSGSPMYDTRGNVLGMVVAKGTMIEGAGFAIPSSQLHEFLKGITR